MHAYYVVCVIKATRFNLCFWKTVWIMGFRNLELKMNETRCASSCQSVELIITDPVRSGVTSESLSELRPGSVEVRVIVKALLNKNVASV